MDLILFNGIGYTMDDEIPQIEAIAIKGNIIKEVGKTEDILKLKTEDTILINLNKHTFTPGFNDSHLHLYGTGSFLLQVNLLEVDSIKKAKEIVRKYIEDNRDQEWIIGRGWNQDYFIDEKRYLTRKDLDEVSSTQPIVLNRACGHLLTANSKAIEIAGITSNINIEDGTIDLENGIFTENAIELITKVIPEPSIEQIKSILIRGMKHANSFGITSLQTDDLGGGSIINHPIVKAYFELQKENSLSCRIYEQSLLPRIEELKAFHEAGYNTGVGDEFFKFGPLKLLADGSLGARTAALHDNYADDKITKGILIYQNKELKDIISYAHQANMQIAVHCIGDRAMDQVLDMYEEVLKEFPKNDHRHGIVHCQIMGKEIHNRFSNNNIIAYIQPIFIHYDHLIVEKRVGSKLANTSYAFKSLVNKGVKIAIGTDSPIELINPFNNIYTAVSRKSLNKTPDYGWYPEEALTVDEALKAYTIGSSYASFTENIKGKLAKNFLADIAILSKDLYNIPVDEILETEVLMTIVDGRVVYEKDFDN